MTSRLKITAAVIVMTAASLHSCAYFNTLYNARKIYREAEESRKQEGSERQLRDKYKEVVRKCAKIVRDYPNSRWMDDALFLMGQALVRQGELSKGIRKFLELITNYPKSDYVPRSLYWLTYAHYEKKDYNQALVYADRFLKNHPKHELRVRLMFLAGDINLALDDTDEALNFYSMVAEQYSKKEIANEAILKSAALFFEKEQWEEAAANYEKVLRKGLKKEERYNISFALGECYTRTGKCREALEIFDNLLDETTSIKEKPGIKLGQASGHVCMDSLHTALSIYKEIVKEFPRSVFSAEAYYRMGIIYQERLDSLARAEESFSNVGKEYANSEFAAVALQRSNSLKRLIELEMTAGKDSGERKAEKKFLAAEIQLTRFDDVKLALKNYQVVVDSFPEATFAPKAAFAIAWIHHRKLKDTEKAIEKYRYVARRYPLSFQARGAVDEMGNLGAEELKALMGAFVDSALADTTGTARRLWEERKRALADSARVDSVRADSARAGSMSPDSLSADSTPVDSTRVDTTGADSLRGMHRDGIDAERVRRETTYPLERQEHEGLRDDIGGVPARTDTAAGSEADSTGHTKKPLPPAAPGDTTSGRAEEADTTSTGGGEAGARGDSIRPAPPDTTSAPPDTLNRVKGKEED
jgi:TolA-binding protein